MDFEAPRDALQRAISIVGKVVPRTGIHILRCIRIEADGDEGLTVCATDLSLAARVAVEGAVVRRPGAVVIRAVFEASEQTHATVPGAPELPVFRASKIEHYFDALDGDVVEAHTEGSELVFQCGRTLTRMATAPERDYPLVPTAPTSSQPLLEMTAGELVGLAACAGHAVAANDGRPILEAISMTFAEDEGEPTMLVEAIGTDSYRVAVARMRAPLALANVPPPLLLAPEFLDLVAAIPPGETIALTTDPEGARVHICAPGYAFASQVVRGEYPPILRVIENFPLVLASIFIEPQALRRALRAIGGFADAGSGLAIRCDVEATGVRLSAIHSDAGSGSVLVAGMVEVEGDLDEKPVGIGVQLPWLKEAVRAVAPEEGAIRLEFRSAADLSSYGPNLALFVVDPRLGLSGVHERLVVIAQIVARAKPSHARARAA